jgi:ribonuclease HI
MNDDDPSSIAAAVVTEAVVLPPYNPVCSIYTDGCCLGNNKPTGDPSRRAGFGVYMKKDDRTTPSIELSGRVKGEQTNNRGELIAFLLGLQIALKYDKQCRMFTDSKYCLDAYNGYLDSWVRTEGMKADGTPVKHWDLWQIVLQLRTNLEEQRKQLDVQWVKGHSKVAGNEAADKLANLGALKNDARVIQTVQDQLDRTVLSVIAVDQSAPQCLNTKRKLDPSTAPTNHDGSASQASPPTEEAQQSDTKEVKRTKVEEKTEEKVEKVKIPTKPDLLGVYKTSVSNKQVDAALGNAWTWQMKYVDTPPTERLVSKTTTVEAGLHLLEPNCEGGVVLKTSCQHTARNWFNCGGATIVRHKWPDGRTNTFFMHYDESQKDCSLMRLWNYCGQKDRTPKHDYAYIMKWSWFKMQYFWRPEITELEFFLISRKMNPDGWGATDKVRKDEVFKLQSWRETGEAQMKKLIAQMKGRGSHLDALWDAQYADFIDGNQQLERLPRDKQEPLRQAFMNAVLSFVRRR